MYVTYKNNTVCVNVLWMQETPTNNIFAPQMFTLSVFCPQSLFQTYDDFGGGLINNCSNDGLSS